MSERMKQNELDEHRSELLRRSAIWRYVEPVVNECYRARRAEQEQAAAIEALADQLKWAYRDTATYPDDVYAALRLAGRLP